MDPPFPIRASLLSILGAILGGTLWMLIAIAADLERAVPALLVGLLAGAATRLEPLRGGRAQVVAVVATVITLTVVQYVVVRHAVVNELVGTGVDRSISLLLDPGSMLNVTFSWLRIYPIDAVIWALSLAAAYLLPSGAADEVGTGKPIPPAAAAA